jgi:polyhydroxyalkanoate synthesis regulator phasin
MAPNKSTRARSDDQRSLAEQLANKTLDPLGVVMLTRERIQETLEEAVQRGRVTRTDANELAGELLRRGRQQTDDLLAEIERVIEGGRERLESSGRRSRLSEGVTRLARTADRARRNVSASVGGSDDDEPGLPIEGYDSLTARQVQARLSGLDAGELRRVRDYERRHANRKTVLDAVQRVLG